MNKIKKFAKSRWHSIPLGAMAIALVAALLVTGTVFALVTLWSDTWVSPSVTVVSKPLLDISSNLDGGGSLTRELGVEIPLTISIYNPSAFAYTSIQTHTSIYRTDGTIVKGDIELWHQTPSGTWQDLTSYLSLVDNATYGKELKLVTDTANILAGMTDITNLKVTFKTAGVYQASAYSCD
jgi:hypothetical protein